MGERLLCKQEVIGSNPFTSTTGKARLCRLTGAAELHPEAPPANLGFATRQALPKQRQKRGHLHHWAPHRGLAKIKRHRSGPYPGAGMLIEG